MSSNAITSPGTQIQARAWVDELHQWLTTVDHKRLGILYILSALLFLAIGGIEALIIRIQLIHSHNEFVSPQVFNRMPTDGKTASTACWVRRIAEEQFQVFAVNCAHLGCPVRWFPQSGLFMRKRIRLPFQARPVRAFRQQLRIHFLAACQRSSFLGACRCPCKTPLVLA